MKAVILARGLGTRMRRNDDAAPLTPEQEALAAAGLKAMLPLAGGVPFLDFVLTTLADAGIADICLVIGPAPSALRDYYAARELRRIRIGFAVQEQPRGTADALLAAEAFAGSDEFVVLNGDTYYPREVFETLLELDGPGLVAFEREALLRGSNVDAERIRDYAILQIGDDGCLTGLVEKPDSATYAALRGDVYVSMNCWRFDARFFAACRAVPLSPRGEFELPAAADFAVKHMGLRLRAVRKSLWMLDLSRRADVASVTGRLSAMRVAL